MIVPFTIVRALRARRRPLRPDAVPPLRPQRPAAARDLARALAQLRRRPRRSRRAARSCGAPSTSASRTSTSRTTTARRTARPRRPSAGSCATTCARTATSSSISTKAGYDMWPGPYGEWGSRKYLLASLDQSLARMGLDYVDIFYSHRFDPETPLEETMGALDTAVRSGQRALRRHLVVLAGEDARGARDPARRSARRSSSTSRRTRCSTAGSSRSCSTTLGELGVGCIGFSPLAQGMLTDKYLDGIPEGSRAPQNASLSPDLLTDAVAREDPRPERDRAAPRPDARADGARVDAARPAHDLDADRRLERRAARGLARRARSGSTSRPTSSRRSTATRPTADINLWARSSAK